MVKHAPTYDDLLQALTDLLMVTRPGQGDLARPIYDRCEAVMQAAAANRETHP
jgi:hypothetical protein